LNSINFTDEKITSNEPIEADKQTAEIRQEPYSLPDGFQWDTLDLNDPLVVIFYHFLYNQIPDLEILADRVVSAFK